MNYLDFEGISKVASLCDATNELIEEYTEKLAVGPRNAKAKPTVKGKKKPVGKMTAMARRVQAKFKGKGKAIGALSGAAAAGGLGTAAVTKYLNREQD